MIRAVAEAEDRLEWIQEVRSAALVVAVEPGDYLRAWSERGREVAENLAAEKGLAGPVGVEELRVVEIEGEAVLPGELLGRDRLRAAQEDGRGDDHREEPPTLHRAAPCECRDE